MMPITTRQNWNSSEYVGMAPPPPFTEEKKKPFPSGNGRGQPPTVILAALKEQSFLSSTIPRCRTKSNKKTSGFAKDGAQRILRRRDNAERNFFDSPPYHPVQPTAAALLNREGGRCSFNSPPPGPWPGPPGGPDATAGRSNAAAGGRWRPWPEWRRRPPPPPAAPGPG